MIQVLETCQWLRPNPGETFDEAVARYEREFEESKARTPYPCRYAFVREVREGDQCPWGHSWFRPGPDGALELWRANWDSSG